MKPKILLAEADCMFAEAVTYILEQAGFETLSVCDSRSALKLASEFAPDLIVLDVALPAVSRFQLCYDVRREDSGGFQGSLLMLGDNGTEKLRETLLDCGADDYLVKPFCIGDLLAKICALLRRAKNCSAFALIQSLQVGSFLLHPGKNLLEMGEGAQSRPVMLKPKESALLYCLMAHAGTTVTRETLVHQVWGLAEAELRPLNTLDLHVRILRGKLEPDPLTPRHILSMPGVGFRFVP